MEHDGSRTRIPLQGRCWSDLALCRQQPLVCDFTDEQHRMVQRTSKMLWRSSSAAADGGEDAKLRRYLVNEFAGGFVKKLKDWFRSEFLGELKALRASMKLDSDVLEQTRRKLVERVGRTKLYRLKHAFDTMQEGKTKVTLRWFPLDATEEERQNFNAMRPSFTQGWKGTFDQLDEYLAKA